MANQDNKPAFVKRDSIVSGKEYTQLLGRIKERFRRSQIKAAVRVNTEMLEFYWVMGRDISRLYKKAKYGSAFFDCLSLDLRAEFPNQTGFSSANIRYTKRWYEFYNQGNINLQRVVEDFEGANRQRLVDDSEMPAEFGSVAWGQHIDIFTRSKSVAEALFYIEKTIENGWSRPELAAAMDDDLYCKQGKAITNFDEKLPAPFSGLAKAILKSPYDDNPTIGLLICKSKDNTVVEWSFRGMNQPLSVAEYKLSKQLEKMLPSEKELKDIIETYPLGEE